MDKIGALNNLLITRRCNFITINFHSPLIHISTISFELQQTDKTCDIFLARKIDKISLFEKFVLAVYLVLWVKCIEIG